MVPVVSWYVVASCNNLSEYKLTEAGHMGHDDLVAFFRKSKAALRKSEDISEEPKAGGYTSLIFVKENVCEDAESGKGNEFLDPEDSSLTR